jgi:hypothetical protein
VTGLNPGAGCPEVRAKALVHGATTWLSSEKQVPRLQAHQDQMAQQRSTHAM